MTIRITQCARRAIVRASQEMGRYRHQAGEHEHDLLGLIKECGGVAAKALRQLGVDLQRLRRDLEQILAKHETDLFKLVRSEAIFLVTVHRFFPVTMTNA